MEKERLPPVAASDLRTESVRLTRDRMTPSRTYYCADFATKLDFDDFSGRFIGDYWAVC